MAFHIEERKLWKAPWPDVLRLARWLKVGTPRDGCPCLKCKMTVIRRLAARMSRNCSETGV